MRCVRLICVAAIVATFSGGRASAQKACLFDTAGRTDQLALELSVRVFRGSDSAADPVLTRGMGDMLRGHFVPPATFGGLLYPNMYLPNAVTKLTRVFGSIQFEVSSTGTVDKVKWYAASLDQATDDAFEAAVRQAFTNEDFKQLTGSSGVTAPELVRVQLLVTADTFVHSPLARMRVPMVRVDASPVREGHLLVPADELKAMAAAPPVKFELTIDQSGKPIRSSIQIIKASSPSATATALQLMLAQTFKPATIGKCAVPMRISVTSHS